MPAPISVKALSSAIRLLRPDPPVKNSKRWYLTQKEHWLGWLAEYNGPGAYGRQTGVQRDAKYAYNHIVEPEMLLYLAFSSGVDSALVAAANQAFTERTTLMQASGAIRKIIPWEVIAKALWPNATQANRLHPSISVKSNFTHEQAMASGQAVIDAKRKQHAEMAKLPESQAK